MRVGTAEIAPEPLAYASGRIASSIGNAIRVPSPFSRVRRSIWFWLMGWSPLGFAFGMVRWQRRLEPWNETCSHWLRLS